jgi:hypothetical protein
MWFGDLGMLIYAQKVLRFAPIRKRKSQCYEKFTEALSLRGLGGLRLACVRTN